MPLYRVRQPLALREQILPVGTFTRLSSVAPKSIAILVRRGAISEVAGPPLDVLPSWGKRAVRLKRMGITETVQMLDANPEAVASFMKVAPALVRRWQEQLLAYLTAPPAQRGG